MIAPNAIRGDILLHASPVVIRRIFRPHPQN